MALPPFQRLLDDYSHDVHRLLVASVGAVEADDCYQETWISALRAYPRLTNAANLRGWVLTIAHRKAIDHIRARARVAVPAGSSSALEPCIGGQPDQLDGLGDASPWAAVRALPPKQRMAVALRFALDLDYDVIADAMGTSAQAARRNVHEGLKKLREEYSHD